jgi:hypothetical protein
MFECESMGRSTRSLETGQPDRREIVRTTSSLFDSLADLNVRASIKVRTHLNIVTAVTLMFRQVLAQHNITNFAQLRAQEPHNIELVNIQLMNEIVF